MTRIALITTAGLRFDDQPALRIRASADLSRLRVDREGPPSQDLNCVLPLALLREMGEVADTHTASAARPPTPTRSSPSSMPTR